MGITFAKNSLPIQPKTWKNGETFHSQKLGLFPKIRLEPSNPK
jgi:hypothetical protein